MSKKYIIKLTAKERIYLHEIIKKGKAPAYKIKHANILLSSDINGFTEPIKAKVLSRVLKCHINTVYNVRKRYCKQGLEVALNRKKQDKPSRQRILDGEQEAKLIAIACSQPPVGQSRWTLKLLSDKLVHLEIVDSISEQTVMRTLKKTNYDLTYLNNG